MSEEVLCKEEVEDAILLVSQEIGESAFEKFTSGEISQSEFEDYSNRLRNWTAEVQRLLRSLCC